MLRRFLPALLALACAERIEVASRPDDDRAVIEWSALLDRATRSEGVDYDLLERDRPVLHRYLGWVAEHGPISDGMRESAEDKRLSFLLNAYNAAVIEGVLRQRPIDSVRDVKIGLFRYRGSGFFVGQQVRVDGEWISLYRLQSQSIVNRYQEPLVHVALNCASRGCPPLRWWGSKSLQGQLEKSMRNWLATDDALRPVGEGYAANEIFSWYEDDFLDWTDAETLCEWMAEYTTGERKAWMRRQDDCVLSWIPYDWSLNGLR